MLYNAYISDKIYNVASGVDELSEKYCYMILNLKIDYDREKKSPMCDYNSKPPTRLLAHYETCALSLSSYPRDWYCFKHRIFQMQLDILIASPCSCNLSFQCYDNRKIQNQLDIFQTLPWSNVKEMQLLFCRPHVACATGRCTAGPRCWSWNMAFPPGRHGPCALFHHYLLPTKGMGAHSLLISSCGWQYLSE